MSTNALIFGGVVLFMALLTGGAWYAARREKRRDAATAERNEALFKSMFPELQPAFHPRLVFDYVRARRGRRPSQKVASSWNRPPGFAQAGAAVAETVVANGKESTRLKDSAGGLLGEFLFEETSEGGVLRVGQGKITAVLGNANPRVRYWHPDREFKWSVAKGWVFTTPIAAAPVYSDNSSSSFSSRDSDPSGSSSSAPRVEGGGGTFDGGGASAGWDDGGKSTSSSSPSY